MGSVNFNELLKHDRPAALRDLTLAFRREAKEASDRAKAWGVPVADGRRGEPLPAEEDWVGVPVRQMGADEN